MTEEPKATKVIVLLTLLNLFLAGVLSYQTLAYNYKTQKLKMDLAMTNLESMLKQ